jgi:hypothetical protein
MKGFISAYRKAEEISFSGSPSNRKMTGGALIGKAGISCILLKGR